MHGWIRGFWSFPLPCYQHIFQSSQIGLRNRQIKRIYSSIPIYMFLSNFLEQSVIDTGITHWRKSNRGRWGLSPTSEGGEQFSRKTLTIRITICWIKQSSLQLSSFQLQWQWACFHLICRFHKLTLILSIHFTGSRSCHCIFVPIHDFLWSQ